MLIQIFGGVAGGDFGGGLAEVRGERRLSARTPVLVYYKQRPRCVSSVYVGDIKK